jgi:hypothetical protein
MQLHLYPALVTGLALLVYVWTIMACGNARGKFGIRAPATTGHPDFECAFRIQQNTMEQLVLFLPSLWLFSLYVSPFWGAILGIIFVLARFGYVLAYRRNPEYRGPFFGAGGVVSLILLLGGIAGIVKIMLTGVPFQL